MTEFLKHKSCAWEMRDRSLIPELTLQGIREEF